MAPGISFEEEDGLPALIEISVLTEPGILTALPDLAAATALDLLQAFSAQGVDLGNPRNAEIVQATIRVVDDHLVGPLHAVGALDTEAYGRLMQALAGLSLTVSDATFAVTGTGPTES